MMGRHGDCADCGVKRLAPHLRNLGRAHKRGSLAGLGAMMPGTDPGQVPWGLGEAGGRFFGGEDIGGLDEGDDGLQGVEASIWPTTGNIDDETNSLAITISTLGHDYAASSLSTSNPTVDTWQRGWNGFVTDFLAWKSSSYFWNPTRRDELVGYRARFNALLAAYQGLGGPTFQAAVEGAAAAPDSLDKIMTAAKWGVLALGIGLAYKVTADLGLLKRIGVHS